MDLYLKIGNQNIFFIFTDQTIIKYYIIPSYVTINTQNEISYIGPYSLLQYIINKQIQKITNYPPKIFNKKNNYDYYVTRLVQENLITDYKLFFNFLKLFFESNLEKKYNIDLINDYEKFNIPYFTDFENFYKFIKQIKQVYWINFLENSSAYFVNQFRFLRDSFRYFRLNLKKIPFYEYFYKFYPKIINIYIAEFNSLIWIINKYGFIKYKKIPINLRQIKEHIANNLIKKNIFLSYNEIENLISFLFKDTIHSQFYELENYFEYIEEEIKNFIIDLFKDLPITILEDVYREINNKDYLAINYFKSVVLQDTNISKKFVSIFKKILTKT